MTSKLAEARAALHAKLTATGLPAERTHLHPQYGSYPTPSAWVGLPSITNPGRGVIVTFPVVLAFDGARTAQVAQLDDYIAPLWDALRDVDLGAGKATVLTAEPQALGPEGSQTLAVVLTVQVPLSTQTLCDPAQLTRT